MLMTSHRNFLHKPIVYPTEAQLSGTETSYTVCMLPVGIPLVQWTMVNNNREHMFLFTITLGPLKGLLGAAFRIGT